MEWPTVTRDTPHTPMSCCGRLFTSLPWHLLHILCLCVNWTIPSFAFNVIWWVLLLTLSDSAHCRWWLIEHFIHQQEKLLHFHFFGNSFSLYCESNPIPSMHSWLRLQKKMRRHSVIVLLTSIYEMITTCSSKNFVRITLFHKKKTNWNQQTLFAYVNLLAKLLMIIIMDMSLFTIRVCACGWTRTARAAWFGTSCQIINIYIGKSETIYTFWKLHVIVSCERPSSTYSYIIPCQ